MKKILSRFWPILLLILLTATFFYKFFLHRLIPMPTDIIVGLYYPWLTNIPVKNPLISDIVSIIVEWRLVALDSLKIGQFPLWNPHIFFGTPLFANFQSSIINFTNLLFLLPLPFTTNWSLMIIAQVFFAICCSFYYLRSLKLSSLASIVGSIVFSFSLFSVVWMEYGVHLYTAAFLPLILGLFEKRRFSLLSLAVALQIYAGYPQYAIYSLIFLIIYVFTTQRQLFLKTSLSIFWGLLLSAPILLPGFELIKLSINSIDTTANSGQAFLPVHHLFTTLSPNFWGNPATYDYFGRGFYDNNAFFPGIIAIFAFIYFLFQNLVFKRFTTKNIIFLSTIFIAFILAVQNPLSVFLKNNFGLIFAKNGLATRIFVLSNLAFAYLTAALVDSKTDRRSLRLPTFFTLLWFVALLFFAKSQSFVSLKNTIYSLIFFVPILALLYLPKFKPLLILIVFGELFYYGQKYLPFSPVSYFFPHTPSIDFVQKNISSYRTATFDTMPENMWIPYGLKSADGYETTLPLRNYQYFSLLEDGRFPSTATRARKLTNFRSPLVNQTSVKYIFKHTTDYQHTPTEFPPSQYQPAFSENNILIVENSQALPRARLSKEIVVTNTRDLPQQIINHPNTVFVTQSPNFNLSSINNCADPHESVSFAKDTPNYISLSSSSQCPRFLVLADAFYPGWSVKINRQKSDIYPTNHLFRGVFLPPGQHLIEFTYFPSSLIFGLILIIPGLIGLILCSKK